MLQRSHYHFASSACPHSPRQELELDVEAGAGLDEAHLRQDLHVLSHFRAHLEGQLQGRAGPVGGGKCGQISKALTANSFFSQCKTAICLHHNHQNGTPASSHWFKDNQTLLEQSTSQPYSRPLTHQSLRSHYMVSDIYLARKKDVIDNVGVSTTGAFCNSTKIELFAVGNEFEPIPATVGHNQIYIAGVLPSGHQRANLHPQGMGKDRERKFP